MYEESVSEKDGYIIKISKLEALIDDHRKNTSTQTKKVGEQQLVSFCIVHIVVVFLYLLYLGNLP